MSGTSLPTRRCQPPWPEGQSRPLRSGPGPSWDNQSILLQEWRCSWASHKEIERLRGNSGFTEAVDIGDAVVCLPHGWRGGRFGLNCVKGLILGATLLLD